MAHGSFWLLVVEFLWLAMLLDLLLRSTHRKKSTMFSDFVVEIVVSRGVEHQASATGGARAASL